MKLQTEMSTTRLLAIINAPCSADERILALAYAKASREHSADFKAVNAAIVTRYGGRTLADVKKRAASWAI